LSGKFVSGFCFIFPPLYIVAGPLLLSLIAVVAAAAFAQLVASLVAVVAQCVSVPFLR